GPTSPAPVAVQEVPPAIPQVPVSSEPGSQEIRGLPQGPPPGKALRARTPASQPARPRAPQHDSVAYAADGAPAAPTPASSAGGADSRHAPEEPATSEPAPLQRPVSNPVQLEPAQKIDRQELAPTSRERAEADFREALAALSAGDSTRAEQKLRAALALDPLADNARQALLGLYVNGGRREEAELLLD